MIICICVAAVAFIDMWIWYVNLIHECVTKRSYRFRKSDEAFWCQGSSNLKRPPNETFEEPLIRHMRRILVDNCMVHTVWKYRLTDNFYFALYTGKDQLQLLEHNSITDDYSAEPLIDTQWANWNLINQSVAGVEQHGNREQHVSNWHSNGIQ